MSEEIKNPLAFPKVVPQGASEVDNSMTLRDYFAGLAMQARIVALGNHMHTGTGLGGALAEVNKCHTETAERAYRHADAMLAERAK